MAIKFEKSKGDYTSFGGLKLFERILEAGKLKSRLREFMPTGQRITADKSYKKFLALTYGMIVGNDCIEDMDRVTCDPIFDALCQRKTFSSQNYGSFLRSFSPWQARKMKEELKRYALFLRRKSFPKDKNFVIDLDSTLHRQYAKKMEGVEHCYAEFPALSSLHAYDQYGFQYFIDVRPGATHTAKGASPVILDLFRGIPRDMFRFFRADSGYCNHGVMQACEKANASFVICMPENMYAPMLKKQRLGWWKWKPSKHTKFRDGRLAELVSIPYYIKGRGKALRVVVMRSMKKQRSFFEDQYDYRAFVTDLSKSEMSDENVIDFYKKRGNAENFIKENKNAFDMHHFPCRKLLSNNIWSLITAFAYNTMRFSASVLSKKVMHYAKRIRFRMIYLGAHVVKKSRYWIIRLNKYHYEEVVRLECRIQKLLAPG